MTTATPTRRTAPNLQDKIRARAYQLFEQRGYTHGFALEDWLRAESEVQSASVSAPNVVSRRGSGART